MSDHGDLNEIMARLSFEPIDVYAEIEAARRAAAAAPLPEPSIIPMPEFPAFGLVRYPCPLGCGWHHDEHPGRDVAAERLVLPADVDRLDEALTAHAYARAEALKARIEAAISGHFEQAHPGR
ncbi:hypothetical protein PV518_45530 [Streptomyces sp. ND04-05B]|uniref:hypothetical protein n=1 Tax=Streptomyces sp. ND04-05B TaxID=3028693 RepID=UPI0029ADC75A|nr:hypothetical protein [Streptomyces sp. ND04-05B]MDX3069320.1 hypothetical protein [Streptomyces sp. ND04-05B]